MPVQVDLQQLASPRAKTVVPHAVPRNRLAWLTRYVLPLTLVAGFVGTLLFSFREALVPATAVTVTPVMAVRAEIGQSEAPLFQSAGWVEPRPTAVIVSSIEEGIVEKLFVIEGQQLKAGEIVARLIEADARLRLQQAEAEVKSREAELASGQATLAAAEIRLHEPIELETKIAEAEAMLARLENEISRLPSQVKAAEARAKLAAIEQQSRSQSSDVVGKLAIARAENEFHAATAAVAELEAQRTALKKEQEAQQRRLVGLQRQLELKVDENRQRDEARAAIQLAEARLDQAKVMLETAKLSLSRTTIYAPCDGKVLALLARPGSKVMGLAPASMPDASTLITMYDPARLQIRADVRLEDVPRVLSGQKVRIETPAVKGSLDGEVIATTSFTDIQKNTLQVKIAIHDPPPVLKPDMLVQCTFLSPAVTTPKSEIDSSAFTLLISPTLIEQDGDTSTVWLADRQQGVARLRTIVLGGATADGMREVKSGLAVGDRLIVGGKDALQDGQRIRITDEATDSGKTHNGAAESHSKMKMKRL
jgi:HlyD family secretion protein